MKRAAASAWSIGRLPWTLAPRGCSSGRRLGGGRSGFDAMVIGFYEGRKLLYSARVRNGFTPATREKLFRVLKPHETDKCPFSNLPEQKSGRWGAGLTTGKMKECRWLDPSLVAQFEFLEWSGNHLRHPHFVGMRDDKDPCEVVKEA